MERVSLKHDLPLFSSNVPAAEEPTGDAV